MTKIPPVSSGSESSKSAGEAVLHAGGPGAARPDGKTRIREG